MKVRTAVGHDKSGLVGKRIALTGASSGIGAVLAERLAADNDVAMIGRNVDALHALERRFPKGKAFPCDLSQRREVEALGRALNGPEYPPLDIVICNAATQSLPGLSSPEFSFETMESELAVNFVCVCQLVHLLLPRMAAGSTIVLINSGLAIAPKSTAPIYCASKAALRSLGQSLAIELAPLSIRVLQVYLPLVDTPMTQGRGSGKLAAGVAAESILQSINSGRREAYVGKARLLWWLFRLAPGLAHKMMARL